MKSNSTAGAPNSKLAGPAETATVAATALRQAAIAIGAPDSVTATAILGLSDEHLGKLLKQAVLLDAQQKHLNPNLQRVQGLLDMARRELVAYEPKTSRVALSKAGTKLLQELEQQAAVFRNRLVQSGELVSAARMWADLSITRQALSKALSAHRIFTVDVGADQFYPAFFLSAAYDRRKLEAITKLLGDLPGWSKWQFFTSPKGSLGNLTPLQALERGQFTQVKNSAQAFAER